MDAHLSNTYFEVPFLLCLSVNDVFLADIAVPTRGEGGRAWVRVGGEEKEEGGRGACVRL